MTATRKPRHLNPNKCRSGDVDRSHEAAVVVRSAADLTDDHVRLLIEMGGERAG